MIELKKLLLEIEEMMQGDFSNANPNKGSGRRFIPPNIDIPKDFIKSVNEEPNGPHIKLIGNPQGEKFLLISSYLKLALEESKRGRTSRDSLMQQNKLLKRFNELIEKYPPNVRMFKGILKKSLENQRLRDTPFGKFFVSELIVDTQTEKDSPYVRIKNPSQTGMAGGLEAPGMFENKKISENNSETIYGKITFGVPVWKLKPIEIFLKKKFPNEENTINNFLYTEAPTTYPERSEYPGFYKGYDSTTPHPIKSSNQEAEAYFTKDYIRFKNNK